MAELTLNAIVKNFANTTALDGVSLHIESGEFVCLLGASGCGKTTLLRIIAGLEFADQGKIFLDKRDLSAVPCHQRNIGMVFQSLALFPHLNVSDNVSYGLKMQRVPVPDRLLRAKALLGMVGLSGFDNRKVASLSGGQRQRVAIARALAQEPTLFLMDEPFSALDAGLRDRLQIELKNIQRKLGITTIFVTHDQREAMALADVMAVMDAGRILQSGPPEEIYDRPATRAVARFIGRGTLLKAPVANGQALIAGQTVPVEGGAGDCVLLRPQHIAAGDEGAAASVTSTHYRGGFWEASASVEGLDEQVQVDLNRPVRVGENLRLTFLSGRAIPT